MKGAEKSAKAVPKKRSVPLQQRAFECRSWGLRKRRQFHSQPLQQPWDDEPWGVKLKGAAAAGFSPFPWKVTTKKKKVTTTWLKTILMKLAFGFSYSFFLFHFLVQYFHLPTAVVLLAVICISCRSTSWGTSGAATAVACVCRAVGRKWSSVLWSLEVLLLLQYKSAPALSDLTRVCWILSRQFNQHLGTCKEAAVKSASWSKPYKQFPYLPMHQLLFLGGVLVVFFLLRSCIPRKELQTLCLSEYGLGGCFFKAVRLLDGCFLGYAVQNTVIIFTFKSQ